MYIVDSHCDSIQQVDQRRHGIVNPYNFSSRCPQLQFVALFCSWPGDSPVDCFKRAVRYLGQFTLAMAAEADRIVQVRSYAEIEAALASGRHAALLTIEGGTGILGSEKILRDFFLAGVRVFGLAWLTNDLAKSNRLTDGEPDTGLTDIGRAIVTAGNALGMIFDVSHLSDKSFWDVLSLSVKPPVATHSNFRALCGHSRNLTDEMTRALIARGGMIGLNLCPEFVHDEPAERTVDNLLRHLDHGLALGGEDCIGFGCDIDGTSGKYPAPLDESCSIHDRLFEAMLRRNYTETLVEKIAGGNWLRYLRENLPQTPC